MKKYKTLIGIILVVLGLVIIFKNIVIINGDIYQRNVTEVNIDLLLKKNPSLKKISYFNNLEHLGISSADNKTLESMPYIKSLDSMAIYCSNISNASINIQKTINKLHLFDSEINVSEISLSQIKSLDFVSCRIENFNNLTNLKSLKDLQIYRSEFEGVKSTQNEYILEDSTVFADFDTVNYVELKGYKINDISGFIDMDSLKIMYVNEESLNKAQIKELSNNKIEVSFDYINFS